ncbi:preprotein translocase subunit SecG [Candidatus Riflebacteria bacterium]
MFMYFAWFCHLLLCIGMIIIILLQADKSGGIQGAFGGGGTQVVFGAPGTTSPIVKLTAFVAIGFMCSSLFLSYRSGFMIKRSSTNVRTMNVDSIDLNLNLPEVVSQKKDSKK